MIIGTRLLRALCAVLFVVCLATATAREARAYTDPGSGMIMWQALCAGFVGCLFYIRKLLARFDHKKSNHKDVAQ